MLQQSCSHVNRIKRYLAQTIYIVRTSSDTLIPNSNNLLNYEIKAWPTLVFAWSDTVATTYFTMRSGVATIYLRAATIRERCLLLIWREQLHLTLKWKKLAFCEYRRQRRRIRGELTSPRRLLVHEYHYFLSVLCFNTAHLHVPLEY